MIAWNFELDDDRLVLYCGYLKGNLIEQAIEVVDLVFLPYHSDLLAHHDGRVKVAKTKSEGLRHLVAQAVLGERSEVVAVDLAMQLRLRL
jgi:hypothetical protein